MSKVNLIVFCRSTLVYILNRLGARVKAEIWARKSMRVLLPLMEPFQASLSLPTRVKLQ